MPAQFSTPLLCYVTDRQSLSHPDELAGRIALAVSAGVSWIQIREKDLSARDLLALVRSAVTAAAEKSANDSPTRIIVNGRLDVALAARADGVHLGESSVPVAVVNEWRRGGVSHSEFMVGKSCHSLESACAAERDGADYIFFGPVFATPSKAAFGAPQGIKRLEEVSGSVKIPVLAIGGINAENVGECLAAGAAGIAGIRIFQESRDLSALVAQLHRSA